jgi:hypothetical protein
MQTLLLILGVMLTNVAMQVAIEPECKASAAAAPAAATISTNIYFVDEFWYDYSPWYDYYDLLYL